MLGPKCTICVVMSTMQIHPSILHLITSVMLHKLKPVFAVVAKRRKMPQLPGNLLTTLADQR